MNILKKDDFYFNATQNDWVTVMDIAWAYEHYAHMDEKQLKEYWQKKGSVGVFLLNIEDIGEKAFQYFAKIVIKYIQEQSIYWDESFEVFDDRSIDDDALWAFESFPNIIERRYFKKKREIKEEFRNIILEFTKWALNGFDIFYEDIFLDKEVLQATYCRLQERLVS